MANKRPLTDEEKARRAENLTKAREAKATAKKEAVQEERTYTRQELDELIAKAVASAIAKNETSAAKIYREKTEEVVDLMFIDEVSPDNVINLGEFGSLVGPGATISISKRDFMSRFLDPVRRKLLAQRALIVTGGLTAEERKRYGVAYEEGSILDLKAFDGMLDFDEDTICSLFEKLCPDHKRMVAVRYATAYENGDNRIRRDTVERLNELSKTADPAGMFTGILRSMAAKI